MVGGLGFPPYNILRKFYKQVTREPIQRLDDSRYETIEPLYYETDLHSLISIRNKDDIIEKRKKLFKYIWGDNGFPDSKMPEIVQNNHVDIRYSDLKDLEKIDKIFVSMDYGFNSISYHFHPYRRNKKLVIYHQGHFGGFIRGKHIINAFLNKGYSVLVFSMPLLGQNSRPIVELKKIGKIRLISHNQLKLLDSDNFSPIKFFVEPIAISLNYIEKNFNYSSIYMVGISGGGWTTVLYSALDQRISKSYPVAGSLPIFLRNRDFGDYEQTLPDLYRIANYLELYILGSYGDGRSQLQIINKYDHWFEGVRYKVYEEELKKRMSTLGKGRFEVYLDSTHRGHRISNNVLNIIIDDFQKNN